MNEYLDTTLSQICHLIKYTVHRPVPMFETGKLILSIDVDAGSPKLGQINKGKNDYNVNNILSESAVGKIEQVGLPIILDLFEAEGIPATFAVRGQLAEVDSTAIDCILTSRIRHDIGSHGFSHRRFTDLSREEAFDEVISTSQALADIGVSATSFIFPKNCIAHLDVLENCGIMSYRGNVGLRKDGMATKRCGNLLEIEATMALNKSTSLSVAKRVLDIGISRKAIVHFWFHLWNFGESEKELTYHINRVLLPLLSYAKQKEQSNLLSFKTMLSIKRSK